MTVTPVRRVGPLAEEFQNALQEVRKARVHLTAQIEIAKRAERALRKELILGETIDVAGGYMVALLPGRPDGRRWVNRRRLVEDFESLPKPIQEQVTTKTREIVVETAPRIRELERYLPASAVEKYVIQPRPGPERVVLVEPDGSRWTLEEVST